MSSGRDMEDAAASGGEAAATVLAHDGACLGAELHDDLESGVVPPPAFGDAGPARSSDRHSMSLKQKNLISLE